jgi:hypothetical protein
MLFINIEVYRLKNGKKAKKSPLAIRNEKGIRPLLAL